MSEAQKVKANGYGDSVIKQFQTLRSENELCDFKVLAQGRVFEVHRALLAATSDYFRVMFKGVMAESRQDTVDLKGVSADGLQQVIDFIYSGEMTLSGENLTEVINTASHLQVASAIDVCSSYIKSLLTFDNYEELLSIADTYTLDAVVTHWENMIHERFMEFTGTQAFLKMDGDKLSQHLAQNSIRIQSEYQLFLSMDKWFRYQASRYAQDSAKLVGNIRFGLMSEQELTAIRDTDTIKRCPVGQTLLAKGYHYHMDSKKGHPNIDDFCKVRADKPAIVMVHLGTSHMPFQITAFNPVTKNFYCLFSDVNGIRDCRVASVDNFAYICRVVDFGGGTLMSSLFRFDPRHLIGQELRPMRRLRLEFACVSHSRCLYAFGGTTEQFAILDSVECYNVQSNTWDELPPLPAPTHSLAAVSHGPKIYLSGGVSGQDRSIVASFISYDPLTRRYEAKPSMFYPRRLHDMIAFKNKIFALGGITRQGIPLYGQIPIECFDMTTNQWTMLSSTLGGRSVGHYLFLDEGQILSLGHEHHSATEEEMWLYLPDSDSWSKYSKAPQRMSLNSALSTQLYINFFQEKVSSKIMKDK
ncbi:kelch-like protein 36 [Biomphalaria pfeifferi]|uniref:Kelch-like protein 36 n=1 Tax=Biomphalaria pfeifferi TaxID=112525 RepID=A0AAD8C516_BIOPF|nr:kelch-like protein 36 [Biomphalaria pfeifferi]